MENPPIPLLSLDPNFIPPVPKTAHLLLPATELLRNPMGTPYRDLRLPQIIHTAPLILPDTSQPPPPLPPGYRTRQYPARSDIIHPGRAPGLEMRRISLSSKWKDESDLKDYKDDNWESIRRRNEDKIKYCRTCSRLSTYVHDVDKEPVVQHWHYSSKADRVRVSVDSWGNYYCTTCKLSPHSHKVG